jgi:hypothetical protein
MATLSNDGQFQGLDDGPSGSGPIVPGPITGKLTNVLPAYMAQGLPGERTVVFYGQIDSFSLGFSQAAFCLFVPSFYFQEYRRLVCYVLFFLGLFPLPYFALPEAINL